MRLALASRGARAGVAVLNLCARGRRYIKLSCVDPHLLYLEAGADHLAGDRGLVRLFDCLRHGRESRAQRATRAVVAAVLNGAGLFLVASGGVMRPAWRCSGAATAVSRPGAGAAPDIGDRVPGAGTAGSREALRDSDNTVAICCSTVAVGNRHPKRFLAPWTRCQRHRALFAVLLMN